MPVRKFKIRWMRPSTNRINTRIAIGVSKRHAINRTFSAKNRNQGYKYLSEYINNLIALNDIRSLVIIDQYLEELTKKREDNRTDNDYDFFMFLLRRKAYCMIELKQFDSAEGILLHILKNDPENEFAKEEIEYLKQLRNSE
jgi:hypothetical protein